jgi:hypothetical protein
MLCPFVVVVDVIIQSLVSGSLVEVAAGEAEAAVHLGS